MSSGKTDVILGVVTNYDFPALRPFLDSLTRTSYRGEVHFFVKNVPEATLAVLRERGVHLHPFRFRSQGLRNSWGRFWPFLRALRSRLLLREVCDLFVLRYFLYRDFLATHQERFRYALLTDVRDVAFQDDPFAGTPDSAVHLFAEDERRNIAACPVNSVWMQQGFGEGMLARIGNRPVICAGTILGVVPELLPFLDDYLDVIGTGNQSVCVEQSALNVMAYTQPRPKLIIHRNGDGPVLNLCGLRDGDFVLSPSGRVLRRDQRPHPVLHEYDRVASVRARIEAEYGGYHTDHRPDGPGTESGLSRDIRRG